MVECRRTKTPDVAECSVVNRLIVAIQQLSLAKDLDGVTEIVRRTARELTGADGATFVLREGSLCHYVDEDAIGPLWKGLRFPMETCISGWAMLHRQAIAIDDICKDSRIPVDSYRPTFVKSLLMVPIRAIEPIGAIGNYWACHHRASGEEIRYLQALADATAVAIERVRLYQELEQRVRERTSALEAANERLATEMRQRHAAEKTLHSEKAQARGVRQERDHLVRVLASGIAHELNQPLSAANTYVDAALRLLRRESGDSRQVIQVMEKATAQNWRAINIVRQFRELLRRGEPDLQVWDARDLLRSATELVEESTRDSGFAVGLDLGSDSAKVRCDRSQIEHVVMNLLRNALEAMRDARTIRGSVRMRMRRGQAGLVQVSIADDGPGLSSEALADLFAPFHTTKGTGLGLGLSVSRGIIEAHGGQLWADSNERGGATFHFTLPAA